MSAEQNIKEHQHNLCLAPVLLTWFVPWLDLNQLFLHNGGDLEALQRLQVQEDIMEVVTRHLGIAPGLKMPQKSKRRWFWSTKANIKRFWIIRGWFPVFDYALFRPGSEFIRQRTLLILFKQKPVAGKEEEEEISRENQTHQPSAVTEGWWSGRKITTKVTTKHILTAETNWVNWMCLFIFSFSVLQWQICRNKQFSLTTNKVSSFSVLCFQWGGVHAKLRHCHTS